MSIIGAVVEDERDEWTGWDDGGDDLVGRKRDRLARLLNVASILYSKGSGESGVPVAEIARLTGMTTRTGTKRREPSLEMGGEPGAQPPLPTRGVVRSTLVASLDVVRASGGV